jgi:hypothetical protein
MNVAIFWDIAPYNPCVCIRTTRRYISEDGNIQYALNLLRIMSTITSASNYCQDCTHHIKNRSNFCVGSGELMLHRGCWHIQSSRIVLCAREDQGCLNETAFSLLPPCKSTSRLDCITQPWLCHPARLFHRAEFAPS